MIKKILLALLILLVLFVVIGVSLPNNYEVSRSIVINGSKAEIHKYVGDLSNWGEWSPWLESDPSLEIKVGDKTKGVGATQSWAGKEGDGRLVFTRDEETRGIAYDLFFMGDENKCFAEMVYNDIDTDKVEVEWNMNGELNLPVVGGYFALMMDGLVGPMFVTGLNNLKKVVEQN